MQITILGAGNVAWHLAPLLEKAGHTIEAVYSPRLSRAEEIARLLQNTTPQDHLDFRTNSSEIFLLCVADDALAEVLEYLILPPSVGVAHTSGSHGLEVLQDTRGESSYRGVFYPLQTFSRAQPLHTGAFSVCIEAENPDFAKKLTALAESLHVKSYYLDSKERQILHLGAVIASNFTNHLLSLAKDILENKEINFQTLKPLIRETIEKALQDGPAQSQTGPARRGDTSIILRQQHYLKTEKEKNPEKIYELLSESIRQYYSEN